GDQGDRARALLPGRRQRGRAHRRVDAGRDRRGRAASRAPRPARDHDRGRPRRPRLAALPDRPHRPRHDRRHRGGAGRHRGRVARGRGVGRARPSCPGRLRCFRLGRRDRLMRVLIREPIADAGVELLRSRFEVDVDLESPLEEIVAGYDAIVIRSATKLTRDVIERGTRLKVIGRAGVGADNVDVDAPTRRGIVVANAPESTIVSAAEQTIGLIVALARNIPQAHAALKQGRWERSRYGGIELAGKTLGVVGFGRIGQQVARRALGLAMNVVAFDPFVGRDRFRDLGVEQVETLDELLAVSDVVTLHSPLTDETRCLIDRDAIALMRDGARLVNAARGALVDEEALAEAIRSGKLAGAALDVFSAEPYSGPLLELDRVVVTPHLAASTGEAQDRAGVIVAEQVVAALDGATVTNAVNIPVVDQADLEVLGPFIPLASQLGRIAVGLAAGAPHRITVAAHGPLSEYDTRLLTAAALNGVFQERVDQVVNVVNATVLAAERGIDVVEERNRASRDYTNAVE